ncbi:tRNA1(Val) (adenine(37)-N6)-methyltransferase [Salimicrobium halophilum]|uniref:tRNA1(Val) A37 N6-methylase TrmN6 n=1 Tax=Salimicrobium halophilum TaxID=86666 RepID=A0A1G8W172_9BACI|nr:tRNA1(Val) (adenine(37)-N6)-methyltransferase [Salimicrobium halophilum]SDJ72121.1 tRNA1(Val) A37 N6-methylase TrmN6 [Salimicrobium halophilum]
MVHLYDDERIDYLLAEENKRIIQSASVFSFSLDAALLARFTYLPKTKGKILDLCTGNGVIPLFFLNHSRVPITGVEIQERLYDMAVRNVKLNEAEDRVSIIHGDLRDMPDYFKNDKFDLVTVNPPYFKTSDEVVRNDNEHLTIARHEVYCTLEEVVESSSKLAKSGGKVSMVHRPERFIEIIELFRAYKLEPKRIQFVYPKPGKEANMILIEGVRDGKSGLSILSPFYMYNEEGKYTEEAEKMLYG